ncbi:MAG TPA: class I SAM-dependent methyltransferase [Caulobacteraceae bacterium]
MMYGLRTFYRYFQCTDCECVQLAKIPNDLSQFYPDDYYSYGQDPRPGASAAKQKVRRALLAASKRFSAVDATLDWAGAPTSLLARYQRLCTSPSAEILDVGAGAGRLCRELRELGYKNALGIDPYVSDDVYAGGELLVRRCSLDEIGGRWDVISFNHVLEHLPDQKASLQQAIALLRPGGSIIVRVPVVGGAAWRKYGVDWVQFDAPRHLYLHSRKSICLLANQVGLTVQSLADDSHAFQFWGSELYKNDISLSGQGPPQSRSFEMLRHKANSWVVNHRADGDQIAVVMTPANDRQPAGGLSD